MAMALLAATGTTRRRLGVLGGMGPAATALFLQELVAHTGAERDQDHIDAVVLSHASLPDRTHPDARDGDLLGLLARDVALLERAGAGCIAMPCNTAHIYHDELSRASSVPLLDMVEEAVGQALRYCPDARAVGVLCTDGTRRDGMYARACLRHGVRAIYPSPECQRGVMGLVYGHVKRGEPGGVRLFEEAYRDVKLAGADVVVLGCTELSVFRARHGVPRDCVDSIDALVRASIAWAGKRYREG